MFLIEKLVHCSTTAVIAGVIVLVTFTIITVEAGHTVGFGDDVVEYVIAYGCVNKLAGLKLYAPGPVLVTPAEGIHVPFVALNTIFIKLKGALVTHNGGTLEVNDAGLN